MSEERLNSAKERLESEKSRKERVKQAQNYHKQQKKAEKLKKDKNSSKSSAKKNNISTSKKSKNNKTAKSNSKKYENISREEKYKRESDERIRNLKPRDFEDGYYIDEYGARRKQKRRAEEIREQESEVIRRNKKPLTHKQVKRRHILVSVCIIFAVIIIGIILSLTVLFRTERIDIEGDEYYYEDQIIAFSNVSLQQNIFIAALNGTPDKISENLPYVERAEIGFSIPDTVTIKIIDAVPSYVVKDGNNFLLISSKGRILDSLTENTDNLPELISGDLKSKNIGDYVSFEDDSVPEILDQVATSLKNENVNKITSFDVTDTTNITLSYDGRIKIVLGLPNDLDYKIKTAMTIINEKLDPNNTGTVAGTLDVSTCSTNKMSHYMPAPTDATSVTEASTAPSVASDNNDGSNSDYSWNGGSADNNYDGAGNYNSYDSNPYNNGYSDNNAYADNGNGAYSDNNSVANNNGIYE